ncbi:14337_t:CDS:1, partial [Racocetra persica]
MTENIKIKIIKLHHKETQKRNNIEHKHAIYEVEPFDYGDHNYSLINIEYQNESDLHEFAAGKNINIQVGEDMTLGEGSTLMIKG